MCWIFPFIDMHPTTCSFSLQHNQIWTRSFAFCTVRVAIWLLCQHSMMINSHDSFSRKPEIFISSTGKHGQCDFASVAALFVAFTKWVISRLHPSLTEADCTLCSHREDNQQPAQKARLTQLLLQSVWWQYNVLRRLYLHGRHSLCVTLPLKLLPYWDFCLFVLFCIVFFFLEFGSFPCQTPFLISIKHWPCWLLCQNFKETPLFLNDVVLAKFFYVN